MIIFSPHCISFVLSSYCGSFDLCWILNIETFTDHPIDPEILDINVTLHAIICTMLVSSVNFITAGGILFAHKIFAN